MPPRRKRKKRSKSIVLDPRIWVKSTDIKAAKDEKLKEQDGNCAIHRQPPDKPVLDHAHIFYNENYDTNPYIEEGRIRGVLESDLNMLEGRYLKIYNRAKIQEKYDISFPDMLINMGEYLKLDNSEQKFHYMYMNEMRKRVKCWRKDYLLERLKLDFQLEPSKETLVSELVQLYMQHWVYQIESTY
jgi:hypothetical protein